MSTSKNTQVAGFPDVWGGSTRANIVDHYGPTSYTTGGETPFTQSTYGGPNSLGINGVYWMSGGITESGNYQLVPIFGGGGAIKAQPKFKWLVAGTQNIGVVNVTATGGSGMTAGTYALSFSAGSAAGTITVTASAVTNITITSPGSYEAGAIPTVSSATGGTPPTLTAVLGIVNGGEVASGTNLSAEVIRVAVLGG